MPNSFNDTLVLVFAIENSAARIQLFGSRSQSNWYLCICNKSQAKMPHHRYGQNIHTDGFKINHPIHVPECNHYAAHFSHRTPNCRPLLAKLSGQLLWHRQSMAYKNYSIHFRDPAKGVIEHKKKKQKGVSVERGDGC